MYLFSYFGEKKKKKEEILGGGWEKEKVLFLF